MSRRSSRVAILDAALRVLTREGLSGLALEDVATEAGLSRQTLYRHFGSRDALIGAAILREEAVLFDVMQQAADDVDELEESLVAAFASGMRWARSHPLLDQLLRDEPEALLPFLLTAEGPVLSAARPVLEELLSARLPEVPPDQVSADADAIARLMVSLTIAPVGEDVDVIARDVAGLVCRGLRRSPTEVVT